MPNKMLFLSHIHEEKNLAVEIKNAIENEFSGFIDVFVSSDGISIPAGSNFLKRIEDALVNCIGAMYLISPVSVKRNWINFELGAVWVRNVTSVRNGAPEIPTLPFLHSGMTFNDLPAPLGNLNGVMANVPAQLEFAFKSLQAAVGGKGPLKTNFDDLAQKVVAFEHAYTLGERLKEMLVLLGGDLKALVAHCQGQPQGSRTTIDAGFRDTAAVNSFKGYEAGPLKGIIAVNVKNPGIVFAATGAVNGAKVEITLSVDFVMKYKDLLLK